MTITLTTIGRRTGKARRATLYAFEDGERLVVVGSKGGASRDPAWAHNLRANPRAVLGTERRERSVHATEVDGPDRDRLWALVCEAFPLYATYQRRTTRLIPLFVLDPVDG